MNPAPRRRAVRHVLSAVLPVAAVMMTVGCDGAETVLWPTLPPQLVTHDELPFGDRVSAKVTRASKAALDMLEPRWGDIHSRIYTVPADQREALLRNLHESLPPGWEPVVSERAFPAERGVLTAYSKDTQVQALLIVNAPDGGAGVPVVLLRNARFK